ncbi:hypothetical protein DXC91_05245 [Bacteroides uniformis]|uniref:Uncharacterized protein n=1 Tax=Bacteroides uniformis TaxID=820 RepID=A0A3E4Q4B2_BACUN|nr:hypothetical protein DXC91_05245 [Bacteroides uniformis]
MQAIKDLDSVRQFCVVLPYGDMNNGADFSDLPDMNHRKNKDVFTSKFELSPYFVLGILAKIPN